MKQSRSAVLRRRRLATSASALALIVVVVVLLTQLGSPSHSHAHPGGGSTTPRPSSSSSPASGQVTTMSEKAALRSSIAKYVAHRHGAVSAAVYDRNSKQLMLFHRKVRGRTASIVKADILETLLNRTDGNLTDDQRETATSMIENSDNDSATELFNEDGGAAGLTSYNTSLGLKQTVPNAEWGLTTTSAADQVTLVRELLSPGKLLTNASRRFQRMLMRHVESDQQWGISGGVPKGVHFGNKNGWLPVTEDNNLWAVNSIGWVHGDGKSYVIAVITQHDATEGYGIHTIQHIARRTWKHASTANDASGSVSTSTPTSTLTSTPTSTPVG